MSEFILQEASPNALQRINSPLPRHIEYRSPLSGSGYTTSMSVNTTAFNPSVNLKFGEFPLKDKAHNASQNVSRATCHSLATPWPAGIPPLEGDYLLQK